MVQIRKVAQGTGNLPGKCIAIQTQPQQIGEVPSSSGSIPLRLLYSRSSANNHTSWTKSPCHCASLATVGTVVIPTLHW